MVHTAEYVGPGNHVGGQCGIRTAVGGDDDHQFEIGEIRQSGFEIGHVVLASKVVRRDQRPSPLWRRMCPTSLDP